MVRDWISGRELDVQGLMKVAQASENVPDELFRMTTWRCGTAGCLIGNFCAAHVGDALQMVANLPVFPGELSTFGSVAARFGLSRRESHFIFSPYKWSLMSRRSNNGRLHVIRRLRKFLYYKLRKAELLADYDQARRTGDVGVMQSAEREVVMA